MPVPIRTLASEHPGLVSKLGNSGWGNVAFLEQPLYVDHELLVMICYDIKSDL